LAVDAVANLSWKVVGVGDFNGDGASDIFWRNASSGQNAVWYSANYLTQPSVAAAATAWRVVSIGDFDADGYSDVMWRNASSGQNTLWRRGSSALPLTVTAVSGQAWAVVPYENQPL
jgi:hypothetical protein